MARNRNRNRTQETQVAAAETNRLAFAQDFANDLNGVVECEENATQKVKAAILNYWQHRNSTAMLAQIYTGLKMAVNLRPAQETAVNKFISTFASVKVELVEDLNGNKSPARDQHEIIRLKSDKVRRAKILTELNLGMIEDAAELTQAIEKAIDEWLDARKGNMFGKPAAKKKEPVEGEEVDTDALEIKYADDKPKSIIKSLNSSVESVKNKERFLRNLLLEAGIKNATDAAKLFDILETAETTAE